MTHKLKTIKCSNVARCCFPPSELRPDPLTLHPLPPPLRLLIQFTSLIEPQNKYLERLARFVFTISDRRRGRAGGFELVVLKSCCCYEGRGLGGKYKYRDLIE